MTTKRGIGALTVVVIVGVAAFFLGRQLTGGGSRAQQPNVVDQLSVVQTQAAQKQAEPRFVGQLLGIYLAPSLDQLPREIWAEDNRLNSGGCQAIPAAQASTLGFPRALVMPTGYVLSNDDPGNTGSNPGALACSGKLRSLGWGYTTTGAGGIPATVSIVRVTTRYDTQDVAQSQVSTQTVGGRGAVIVRSASAGGLAQRYIICFPETFGMTSIQTFNLAEADALKVAEAVAGASR